MHTDSRPKPKPVVMAERRAEAADRRAGHASALADRRVEEANAERDRARADLAQIREDRDRWRAQAERLASALDRLKAPLAVSAASPSSVPLVREDNDLLHGFEAIGRHLGVSSDAARGRAIKERMPVVRDGRRVWIRKVSLNAWLAEREAEAMAAATQGAR